MEIKAYFKILARFWWVIVLSVIAAGGGAFILTKVREPVYATSSRINIRPAASISNESAVIDLIGQLGNRYIAGTYAQTFTGNQVKTDARAKVNLLTDPVAVAADRSHDASAYTIEANVLPDTIVIDVQGTGPNAQILTDYINATTEAAISSSSTLFPVLELQVLAPAQVPDEPQSPQPSRDIPLGAGLGLAVGILLAMALDYLLGAPSVRSVEPPVDSRPQFLRPPMRRQG